MPACRAHQRGTPARRRAPGGLHRSADAAQPALAGGLQRVRDPRAGHLLGVGWIEDLTDPNTGEIGTLRIVTDNGPCFKSGAFAAWVASKRHIVHIRTPKKAPWTNGVIERFFGALKYERLYRHDIGDGVALAAHAASFRTIYNSIRPHESIAMARPLERYRQTPEANFPDPESVSGS